MNIKHFFAVSIAAFFLIHGLLYAQTQSPLDEPLANLDKLVANLKVTSVVGEPIRSGDTTIIPFARISFGLGAGGAMMAYGGGMGGKIIPLGILIIEGDNVRVELFPVEEKKPSFFQEMLPTLLKMLPQIMGGKFSGASQISSGEAKTKEKSGGPPAEASLDQVKKLYEGKKYSEALEMADSLIAQNPNSADFHVWKGHVMGSLAQSGNPMDMMKYGMGAMQEYDKALELDPDNPGAHFGRGVGRLMAPPGFGGDLDGAIADFEFACKKDPFPEAYYYLGEAYVKKGLNDKAKEAYKKALDLKPGYSEAAKALAKLK
ncbi:MAG: spore germination protein GerW family protein [Candidatus Aminicenantales bacterium]